MMDSLNDCIVDYGRRDLRFRAPARTSRDTLHEKPSWFIRVRDQAGREGWGECSIIPGLSLDQASGIDAFFDRCVATRSLDLAKVPDDLPAVRFAIESALRSLASEEDLTYFPGAFRQGTARIPMNGLIWMEEPDGMLRQAKRLVDAGFETLKMKVGALPFDQEYGWLRELREETGASTTLRCDANGAFSEEENRWPVMKKLEALADLGFHSIEQPLRPSERSQLAYLCAESPLPIGLDESLIGVNGEDKVTLLNDIKPQFLILKPSLLGGFGRSQNWVDLAEERGINWWATSALESNLGLYAIAQWVCDGVKTQWPLLPQGLGTGGLFENNVPGSMQIGLGELTNQAHFGTAWDALDSLI